MRKKVRGDPMTWGGLSMKKEAVQTPSTASK